MFYFFSSILYFFVSFHSFWLSYYTVITSFTPNYFLYFFYFLHSLYPSFSFTSLVLLHLLFIIILILLHPPYHHLFLISLILIIPFLSSSTCYTSFFTSYSSPSVLSPTSSLLPSIPFIFVISIFHSSKFSTSTFTIHSPFLHNAIFLPTTPW